MRISDWSSDVCSSDLQTLHAVNPYFSADFDLSLIGQGLDSIGVADFAARLHRDLGWNLDTQDLFGENTRGQWALALQTFRPEERRGGKECDKYVEIRVVAVS